jgi:hypothetical protein
MLVDDVVAVDPSRSDEGKGSRMNEQDLMTFVGKGVGDVAAMVNGALVALGDRLGLYVAMRDAGAVTAEELARRTDTAERYVREWLAAQAAGGFVRYLGDGRYVLPAEQAVVLTDETSRSALSARSSWRRRPCSRRTGWSRRSARARASAGASTTTSCSRAANGSSPPATATTS